MNCAEQITSEATQAVIVCVASSFNWVGLVGPCVIFFSAIVAAVGIAKARASARQRATLDMIEKVESTTHYQNLNKTFSLRRRTKSFEELHDPKSDEDKLDRGKVLAYLNNYELVSIGICEKILDERFYKSWMKGPFLRDWNDASDFIQRERWKWDDSAKEWVYRDVLFENFQKVARKWSVEAVNLTKSSSTPPAIPHGPGDESLPDGHKAADEV